MTAYPNIWLPYTQMKTALPPLKVKSAEGVRITLDDGRQLIDGISSWWAAVHGYSHPSIVDAVQKQAAEMSHVMFGGLMNAPAATLADRLVALTPGDLGHVFFSESGSVSVEIAMKMAVQYWINNGVKGRNKFLSFRGGYHGDTIATMSVCDPEKGMHSHFKGFLAEQVIADLPVDDDRTEALERILRERGHEIAAIITEPLVQGAAGMVFHDDDTLRRIRTLADKHNVLLIVDEIFTGFGRLGHMFACDKAGIVPDIMTVSKALTGGFMPLSAAIARTHVFEAFWDDDPAKALMHGPTYMGHALACAAANASLDLYDKEPRLQQVAAIETQMQAELGECRNMRGVKDVRVMGAIGVVQFDTEPDLNAMKAALVGEGVWLRPFRDIIYLTPAYTIEADDLSRLTGAIKRVVAA